MHVSLFAEYILNYFEDKSKAVLELHEMLAPNGECNEW